MLRFVCGGVLVLLYACTTPPPPPAGAVPASVALAQVNVGDFWEYTVRDGYTNLPRGVYRYEVKSADASGVVVDVTRDNQRVETLVYAPGWNPREAPLPGMSTLRFNPPLPEYAYPLEPGKSWSSFVESNDPATGRTYRTQVQARVVGWERIQVPAGAFDALRIQRYIFAGNMGGFQTQEEISQTDWYVPAVQRAVRFDSTSQHLDTSRSGGQGVDGLPLRVRTDWLISELTRYSVR